MESLLWQMTQSFERILNLRELLLCDRELLSRLLRLARLCSRAARLAYSAAHITVSTTRSTLLLVVRASARQSLLCRMLQVQVLLGSRQSGARAARLHGVFQIFDLDAFLVFCLFHRETDTACFLAHSYL